MSDELPPNVAPPMNDGWNDDPDAAPFGEPLLTALRSNPWYFAVLIYRRPFDMGARYFWTDLYGNICHQPSYWRRITPPKESTNG